MKNIELLTDQQIVSDDGIVAFTCDQAIRYESHSGRACIVVLPIPDEDETVMDAIALRLLAEQIAGPIRGGGTR